MATAVEAAEHICLSVTRFRDMIGPVFTRMPAGGYDLTTVRETYCRHMQRVAAGRGEDVGSLSKQRTKLESARTRMIEAKIAVMRGDSVRLVVVRKVLETLFFNMRETALGIPGKIADKLSSYCKEDRAQIFEIVNDEIYAMLTALSVGEVMSVASDQRKDRRAVAVDETEEHAA